MRLLAVAALSGAAVMILELMAVRLMAPWFGQSQLVWTNVIGVVLAALAAGQWLGGRAAASGSGRVASGLLLGAAAMAFVLPEVVRLLAGVVLPDELPLMEAEPFVVGGSLAVALIGLGLPMVALGALTPWLVRLSRDAEVAPARVAGRILGAGTIGSLLGTFGASHVLLPWVGSAGAVRFGGALLAVAGLTLVGTARGRVVGALVLLGWAAGAFGAGRGLGAEPRRGEVLASVETPYQWARVEQLDDGTRLLRLNEGLDSFHSAFVPGELLTGRYYDAFLMPTLMAPALDDGPRRVLIVGLAAGTMARQIRLVDPDAEIHGVEIDAEIVELGRRFFELPDDVQVAAGMDGRVALSALPGPWSAVFVDAYASQIYLPAHLSTREFFEQIEERLAPGGCVALNLGGLSVDDPVVDAMLGTFGSVFGEARAQRLPRSRNLMALAFDGAWPLAGQVHERLAAAGLDAQLGYLADPDGWVGPRDGAPVLVDGHAPLEALAHRAWRGGSVSRELVRPAPRSPDSWVARASDLVRAGRWSEAGTLLASPPAGLSLTQRARAALLEGNVGFERSDWERADGGYLRCRELASQARSAAGEEGDYAETLVRIADDNRSLVAAAVRDRDERDEQRLALYALLAAALTVVVASTWIGVRRLGAEPAASD